MKSLAAMAAVIMAASATGLPAAASAKSAPSKEPQFCNIYLDTVCFSLPAGQPLDVSLPMDFMLYKMPLPGGGNVTIYSGYNPERALEGKATRKCATGMKAERCEFADDGKVFDLIYDTGGMSNLTHIHIDGLSAANRAAAKALLDGFHACTSHGISMTCTPDKPFRDVLRIDEPQKP
ncbi:hypothetical protein FIV34_18645 [Luteibacter pinisoli]|uniref:Uncharacterized protein n=1 Tax=Luteibacter pinisoli TaxID=2589080 RepID=A0A4Y5Z972_9GAMM|nr:hypothetical protein [Luteibacter pinisoli]QDE41079.1 hypothetical protein FIV34_18645 [Luteibacter pinisoli]